MKKIFSTLVLAALTTFAAAQTKIIAHRGYWQTDSSAQNSAASLHKAADLGCWGSEFDVWITADGVCVVNHDAEINGMRIENSRYADIRSIRLSNGEMLPTLEQYLWQGVHVFPTRLILEIKSHSTKEAERKCVNEVLRLVKKYGAVDQTDYISFSLNVCEYIVEQAPKALNGPNGQRSGKREDKVKLCVEYLGGDLSPEEVKAKGITGIDYNRDILLNKHPEWIDECRKLGLTVNVWTVDDLNEIWKLIQDKADKITTNRPKEALKLSI
jgi:glycerophosphoryl diester phosphodiesterase